MIWTNPASVNRRGPSVLSSCAVWLRPSQLSEAILQHSMKLCTHQENKWQIICLHIVRGGYFCQHRAQKTVSHTTFGRRKKNWAPRRERRRETRGFLCCSMFICFSSQFGSGRVFKGGRWREEEGEEEGGGGWPGVCADPEFVTQTSAALTGWLSGSRRPVRSQPRLKEWLKEGETGRQTDRKTGSL